MLNTEAEANALRTAGGAMAGGAVAVHTAEVAGAARIRRTPPPTVRRPGAVGQILDFAVRLKILILRALARLRIRNRAENLNLREEEELHRVCVDCRALTTGRGFLVDVLKNRPQV